MLLTFGEYELDTELFKLLHNGQTRKLEPQVFDLLLYLAQHRDRIISRQELMDKLWACKVVTESTLSSRIKAVRKAVGDSGQAQTCIATFSRRGYQFIANAEEQHQASNSTINNTLSHKERPSLAVLPFTHKHCSESVSWLTDMLGEDISIQLARIPGFRVISRNSMASYKDQDINIKQVGLDLSIDYLIEGSIREAGNKLRVSVHLLAANSAEVLWSDRNEIDVDKLGQFQDDIIHKIISRIEPELNRAELSNLQRHRPVDLDAWALYRKAHAILSLKGWNEDSFSESAELLRQAISRDPKLAFAHAYLALILAIGHLIGLVHDTGCHEEATIAAETAITLDSQDSDVLGYAGCAFADMGDYQRGIGMMRRAIELDPSNAQAYAALGAALLKIGEEEGIHHMRYGIQISPRDSRLAVWGTMLARGLLSLGNVTEAIEVADYACQCDDKIFLPRLVLAVAQNTAENQDGARAALDDARRIRPNLALEDIARFAVPEEIENLKSAGLV